MDSELEMMPLMIVSLISADNNNCLLEIEHNLKRLNVLKSLLNEETDYLEKIDQAIEILQRLKNELF